MIGAGRHVKGANVIVLGLTFKENCPDLRNSRVIDVVHELVSYGVTVHVHDPVANATDALHEYGITLRSWDELPRSDAIVAAVAHKDYRDRPVADFIAKMTDNGLYIDVKAVADQVALRSHGVQVWRL
jgi:UDP-N-acetyl-D-galactosamine dehydrogenase